MCEPDSAPPRTADGIVRRAEHVLDEADGYRTTVSLERAAVPWNRAFSTPAD